MSAVSPEAAFRAHLLEDRFMIQRSRSTGRYVFFPRIMVPGTGESDLEWVAPSGRGTVYAATVVRQKPPAPSYNIVLIDLEEGPRMMSRVVGIPPEAVKIGQRVQAKVIEEDGQRLVVFEPL